MTRANMVTSFVLVTPSVLATASGPVRSNGSATATAWWGLSWFPKFSRRAATMRTG